MKWKMAIATTAAAAAVVMSAPVANAAPANGNGNGGNVNRTTTSIGQTISAIAKSGGGPAGILSALSAFKPGNLGLANALQRFTASITPTTPTSTPTSTPTP